MLSPKSQFAGRTVLVTGSLGFLGSVVVEKLLRETEVDRVLLLVRGKKQTTPLQRVQQLLSSPLFHLLQKQALHGSNVLSRVQAVEGDLLLPELGLSADDKNVLSQVDVVLHCAASMELQADIQKTLKNNYLGTQKLLQLANSMPNLRAFVHVSTYYVANHLPRNSLVSEQLHPLRLSLDGGATKVGHADFVSALMAMTPDEANMLAGMVMQTNSFGSSYAFGKSLTEQMVANTPIKSGAAKAIVRPALISNLAGSPYPGFVQGYAGPGGYIMAYAMGFFQGLGSVAYGSDQRLDLIPCDTVAALVICAAAAATAAAAADTGKAAAAGGSGATTVYHASSSASHPLPIADGFGYMAEYWAANPPPLRLPLTKYVRYTRPHTPTPASLQQGHSKAAAKARLLAGLMRLAGESRQAYKLLMGVKAFGVQNSIPLAASLVCCVDNVVALRDSIAREERQLWPLLWAPGEPGGMPWRDYSFLMQSAVRQLLFGQRTPENVRRVCCAGSFEPLAAAITAEQVAGLMQGRKIAAGAGAASIRFGGHGRFSRSISTSIRRSIRRSVVRSVVGRGSARASMKRSDSNISISSSCSSGSSSGSSGSYVLGSSDV
uniref:Fatty acyl-CoA reductase n=1 Tax=Tetradesmus obliquus TaxID=3088 RepID=A0A383WJS7_TETOB|eukprot:jgi/Sobl393_1/6243/SZX76996.1